MKNYFIQNEWQIIEEGFNAEYHEAAESIFSIGNGKMGQRAMFEETYSGKSLQGSYVAGVYYPDKTRVGWWKNGYPEYFAKVLNSINWIGMNINIDGVELDLAKLSAKNFKRTLNMKEGLLQRTFQVEINNKNFQIDVERFISRDTDEIACIRYSIKSFSDATLKFTNYLDGHVKNKDSNYDELFWTRVEEKQIDDVLGVHVKTNKLDFKVAASMKSKFMVDGTETKDALSSEINNWKVNTIWNTTMKNGSTYTVEKYVSITSNLYYDDAEVFDAAFKNASSAYKIGYDLLRSKHIESWADVWSKADIKIEGDVSAQQGIRFNIFQLNQTYTGRDPRLNIGPKGFTGEKYGGSTYWDTEAYCLPFYLGTSDSSIALQLLKYRYKQLDKAIENAEKLGFKNGAALYPMVTMNGEECHNEWEITFEEIHRNGAIAFAVFQYQLYTGDASYLKEGGAEVLLAISRFWAQRVHWSNAKSQYVMHGVTGPNEYENNINNNWYTSYIANWCLKYTAEVIVDLEKDSTDYYNEFVSKTNFDKVELNKWKHINDNMFYAYDENLNIFLQQESYLDKEQILVKDLDPSERPINQHWSWDRILRSCFIKQADVLQGIFLFEDHFDVDTIRRNFDFYEPRTVHESSLSPCIHVVLAAKLGYDEKAYDLYLRTSRLDLDDYNKEVHEGLHITSMAGTWMAVVNGFGGLRIKKDKLSLSPMLPSQWKSYSFTLHYRNSNALINVNSNEIEIKL
ncbi:MAG: family 65 glycosyl hydrolase domain-containing protein, partial [bacterium]